MRVTQKKKQHFMRIVCEKVTFWGRLNVARVLYGCSKTSLSQYAKIYANNDRKSIAKSQPLGAQVSDFSNAGWSHARSDFR